MPHAVTKAKLKKGEFVWRQCGNVAVCKGRDKRGALTISNKHANSKTVPVTNKRGNEKQKLSIVGMSGIDRSAQMLSYYSAFGKTLGWYKNAGIHFFEIYINFFEILFPYGE